MRYPLRHAGMVSAAGIEPATNRLPLDIYSLSLCQLSYAELPLTLGLLQFAVFLLSCYRAFHIK